MGGRAQGSVKGRGRILLVIYVLAVLGLLCWREEAGYEWVRMEDWVGLGLLLFYRFYCILLCFISFY